MKYQIRIQLDDGEGSEYETRITENWLENTDELVNAAHDAAERVLAAAGLTAPKGN